jgi:hypothetical protein
MQYNDIECVFLKSLGEKNVILINI